MGTANFKSMDDFPLIVADDKYIKICPECGCGQGGTDKCECCGADVSAVESVYDEGYAEYIQKEMQKVADELNDAQAFYTVSVESGYYAGLQFYVDEKYWKIEEFTNEDAQDEFGMCRSAMLRKYKVAGNTIRRGLRKAKDDLGLMELGVTARFSNGETWYTEIKPNMPKRAALKVAVNAA